jgi:hypothetical protein
MDECPRCGCELAILERIARAASRELSTSRENLEAGNPREALRCAGDSWRLKKGAGAARLAFLAAIAAGDFDQAGLWYGRAVGEPPAGE